MIPILYILSDPSTFESQISSDFQIDSMKSWERAELALENEKISIESVRTFINHLQEHAAVLRLAVIPSLHTAKRESQNALLKLVEEIGATRTQLVAHASDEYSLIPTLRSRFRIAYLEKTRGKKGGLRRKILLDQTLGQNMQAADARTREQALEMIADVLQQLRGQKSATTLSHELIELYDLVARNNVSPEFALDIVAIKLTLR